MPKRADINSVLLIGAGPIIIGQACEFDYSGTQGAKALREEGYEVVLVNSNPATIMTDPEMASRTYVEPLEVKTLEAIIEREKPDAILPTLGGKTFKLKFGHHGGNQPVLDLTTRKVEITAQNHGFAVDAESLKGAAEVTHLNLNDNTVEGLTHRELPIFSVQYHPESSPGPHDANYLFKRFTDMMAKHRG